MKTIKKPCGHATTMPGCHLCHLEATNPAYAGLWKGITVEPVKKVVASLPLVVVDCPHRSPSPTSYCGTCGNSANAGRYDCEWFDEVVALFPRKGMRDCSHCTIPGSSTMVDDPTSVPIRKD
jgi:hypothetical protein